MGLFLSVIEHFDPTGQEMVARVPPEGSADIAMGSQLVVQEAQAAVFYRDGKALDTFGAGRYTLSTQNIPILTQILSLPFGGTSPFRVSVYFVNLKTFTDLKWGTKEPLAFRDTELKMVRLRAFGKFAIQIEDPKVFIAEVVGTQDFVSTQTVEAYLRDMIVQRLNDILGETLKTVLDLPKHYDELGIAVKARVQESFKKYGLYLKDFVLGAITPPDEVQKMMDERAKMSVIGDMQQYMQFKTAESIPDFAKRPGGGGMGQIGMELAVGAQLGGMMGSALTQKPPPPPAAAGTECSRCHHVSATGTKFCPECGNSLAPASLACPKCQAPNASTSKFCGECGGPLASSPP